MAVSIAEALKRERSNLLTAFSLANLCFINIWFLAGEIPAASLNYYRSQKPDVTLLVAALLDVLLLAMFFWTGWRAVVRSRKPVLARFAKALFLLILTYPVARLVEYLSPALDRFPYVTQALSIAAAITLLVGVVLVLFFDHRSIVRTARSVTLLLALLAPSLVIDLGWAWASGQPAGAFQDGPLAAPAPGRKPPVSRVVWFVFDEFDQGMAFDYRPPRLSMPNLDRFRSEAFYASRVNPTARWTMLAMPALISGKLLAKAELKSAGDLWILPEGSDRELNWREQPTIFSEVRAQGMNTAMVGWHHPYCRVLNSSLNYCYWVPSGFAGQEIEVEHHASRIGLRRTMAFLAEMKGEDLLAALHVPFYSVADVAVQQSLRIAQQQRFQSIRSHAFEAATDRNLDLVVVHWPTPHPYGIYDRRTSDFSSRSDVSYIDNLALVDRTVGEFRQTLERAGLWDSTTVLISSDHPLRKEMWREKLHWTPEMTQAVATDREEYVPFLVKFAGDTQAVEYPSKFNAVLTSRIVQDILRGNVRSSVELSHWLDANRTQAPLE